MKIWVWIKISIFSLVALYVLVFVIKNVNFEAKFWYLPNHEPAPTSSLTLAFFSFVAGAASTLLVRTTLVTIRQYREMKERNRQERMQREFEEMRAKAEKLTPKTLESSPVTPPGAQPSPAAQEPHIIDGQGLV